MAPRIEQQRHQVAEPYEAFAGIRWAWQGSAAREVHELVSCTDPTSRRCQRSLTGGFVCIRRYFFHFDEQDIRTPDLQGSVPPDAAAARLKAVSLLRSHLRLLCNPSVRYLAIELVDDADVVAGRCAFEVPRHWSVNSLEQPRLAEVSTLSAEQARDNEGVLDAVLRLRVFIEQLHQGGFDTSEADTAVKLLISAFAERTSARVMRVAKVRTRPAGSRRRKENGN